MATDTLNKFQAFAGDVAAGKHQLTSSGHTLKVALSTVQPVATNSILGDLTAIAQTDLTVPDMVINASTGESSGTFKLILDDKTIVATGTGAAGFRYITIYNDSQTSPVKPLIGWLDYGSTITLGNAEELKLDFNATNGALQIS
jgi:hypothetical protein